MSNIAFIGEEGMVSLFGLSGIDTFGVKSQEAQPILRKVCANENYSIVLITEWAAKDTVEFINETNLEGKKYIMIIPDHTGANDISRLILKKSVEKAVGADILSRKDSPS